MWSGRPSGVSRIEAEIRVLRPATRTYRYLHPAGRSKLSDQCSPPTLDPAHPADLKFLPSIDRYA
jgi:hypothetical protein